MRSLILAFLPATLVAGAASAQPTCTEQCRFLVQEAIRAVADRHGVSLSEVLIDTAGSGYDRSLRQPGVPGQADRLVTQGDLTRLARDLGTGMRARNEAWSCAGDRCTLEGASLLIRFNAPEAEDDRAHVFIVAGYAVDSDYQDGRVGEAYRAIFLRDNGVWRLQELQLWGMS